eukprot:scaffold870_cov268-Pinguiococcus_pyrenoidosus.AAC.22
MSTEHSKSSLRPGSQSKTFRTRPLASAVSSFLPKSAILGRRMRWTSCNSCFGRSSAATWEAEPEKPPTSDLMSVTTVRSSGTPSSALKALLARASTSRRMGIRYGPWRQAGLSVKGTTLLRKSIRCSQ